MSDSMTNELHMPTDELAELEQAVDGVPVLAQVRTLAPSPPAVMPAAQAVAVAATSFVAGAAALALMRRQGARRQRIRAAGRSARRGQAFEIVASRRFMVDIHLLDKPGR